uniref:Uncharacterized protein n=1 Tax=Anguilla anguilla TaxID=7936 RepID=A0A0E9SQ31_ANGAN
MTSESSLPNPK